MSGLWGAEKGPAAGQIHPGMKFGGPLKAGASGGGTGVFFFLQTPRTNPTPRLEPSRYT